MENIGLVTFSNSYNNYGQVLQAYAVQEYLHDRGHDVFLLREPSRKVDKIIAVSRLYIKKLLYTITGSPKIKKSLDKQVKKIKNRRVSVEEDTIHPRHFEEFRQKYFKIIYNDEQILAKNGVTVLCSGSDQIWVGASPFFFLNFGNGILKRISIASSTVNAHLTSERKKRVSRWLQKYDFVSVREDSGINFCKELGYNSAKRILDPTFLLQANMYDKIMSNKRYGKDYVFLYMLGAQSPISYNDVLHFATTKGLDLKYVTAQGRTDDYEKIYATIPEWLNLLKNAKYVITNSFHGMAFSIIYRKKFLVLPRTDTTSHMNERINVLAKEMNLEERIYKNDLNVVADDISFSTAQNIIEDNKNKLDKLLRDVGI